MTTRDEFDADLIAFVLHGTDAADVSHVELVQELWSGYGQIVRCHLSGSTVRSVILKHVRWPNERSHPRGWTTDHSHQRKLTSYQVESTWYENYAPQCHDGCRVPRCLAVEQRSDGMLLLLEDLNAGGFAGRRQSVSDSELDACLLWLANFHATFMEVLPDGLWSVGTYWHLATRPDEFDALDEGPLKAAAEEIDRRLSTSPFQTIVHGDAKLANFCFNFDGTGAAAVDFQYVGGGCGMKDLAYFIGSCFGEVECEQRETELLNRYFEFLHRAIREARKAIDGDELESNWRALYPVAWTDFFRFLQGWSPGHWKAHGYSRRLADEVLRTL